MAQALDGWREEYGSQVRLRDGWLVGRSHRDFRLGGAFLLPPALLCVFHGPPWVVYRVLAWLFLVAAIFLIGSTNEVAVDLATGEARTRRGVLFGLVRERRFVRPQIDGVFMAVSSNPRAGLSSCAVGLQAGVGRWAMYRTSNADLAAGFYRELQKATGFSSV